MSATKIGKNTTNILKGIPEKWDPRPGTTRWDPEPRDPFSGTQDSKIFKWDPGPGTPEVGR